MARISDGILPASSQLGLYLDRYQELQHLDVCAFNGVNRPTDNRDNQCIGVIKQSQRDELAMYLLQAEEMRQEELAYFPMPKWRIEEHDITDGNPFILEMKYLIEIGGLTFTEIESDVALDHGGVAFDTDNPPNDPVVITVASTADVDEIIVRYPGELNKIYPSSISSTGGVVTISIPRCRLVKPEENDDRDEPISYYDDPDAFLETVDVYREWADPASGADFVWRMADCDTDCVPNCQSACAIVSGAKAYELSIVYLHPATFSGIIPTRTNCWTYREVPQSVRVTYRSGKQPSMLNQINTIRLMHTLMPHPPCECGITKQAWSKDTEVNERRWSPYGNMQGALHCWSLDNRAKTGHGGMFSPPGGIRTFW